MSNTLGTDGAGHANEAQETTGKLLDAQGRAISHAAESAAGTLDQVGDYIRKQPFSAAFIALGVGYLIGRLRLL